jgi:hypothetical protein
MPKYSIWELDHESVWSCRAYKVKDTNSGRELDRILSESPWLVASFYREEEELNAEYLQIFQES